MRIASRMRPEGRRKARGGQNIYAASASQAHVQAAIDAANNGDWVFLPAVGSATWATGVTIPSTKGIVLDGNGSTITDAYAGGDLIALAVRSDTGNALTRVTGFVINAAGVTKTGSFAEIGIEEASAAANAFRVDHNTLYNLRTRGMRTTGYRLSGVIDHNALTSPYSGASSQQISVFGNATYEFGAPFDRVFALGTSDMVFIEDNDFSFPATYNDGAVDSYGGARFVFRYNSVSRGFVGTHGADTGGFRGVYCYEFYENTFDNTDGAFVVWSNIRSGTGVIYNNTSVGNYRAIQITNYRSQTIPYLGEPWLSADGTRTWDENQPGTEGYAALDQIGHIFGPGDYTTLNGTNALHPLYVWNNTLNGAAHLAALPTDASYRLQLHVVENRDFYNGIAMPGYTPYTYPHPLAV